MRVYRVLCRSYISWCERYATDDSLSSFRAWLLFSAMQFLLALSLLIFLTEILCARIAFDRLHFFLAYALIAAAHWIGFSLMRAEPEDDANAERTIFLKAPFFSAFAFALLIAMAIWASNVDC